MQLVSMKQEREGIEHYPEGNNPYGYGLCINLTEDQVEALGLKANPPAAGSVVMIHAMAQIVSVTQDADVDQDNDGVDTSIRIQITDMAVESESRMTKSKMSSVLYSGD